MVWGNWFQPVSWFTRNAGTIAKIVIPAGAGLLGGMALQQKLTGPTVGYNSGGAPITIVSPQPQTASDPFSGLMSTLPNMMMMMMMIPMMTSMMRQTTKTKDTEE